jgi:hypothetical protein
MSDNVITSNSSPTIATADVIQEIEKLNGRNCKFIEVSKSPEDLNKKALEAITTLQGADLSANGQSLGEFNKGIVLTRTELQSILGVSLPDIDALLVCLAIYHSDTPISVEVNEKTVDTQLNNILFPVITKVEKGRLSKDENGEIRRYTPTVPGYIETAGTILCPPLPQCPPKE